MPFTVHPMEPQDIPQVAEIEREAFPTTWPPTPFRKEMNNPLARYLVAQQRPEASGVPAPPAAPGPKEGRGPLLWRILHGVRLLRHSPSPTPKGFGSPAFVAGYVSIWFMADEAHITSIAVRSSHRGKGVGELLLIASIELARLRGSRKMTLEVRVSNKVAQSLYLKYGFKSAGLRRGYYADNNEDALIMTTDPLDTSAYQALFQGWVEEYRQRRGEAVRVLT